MYLLPSHLTFYLTLEFYLGISDGIIAAFPHWSVVDSVV
jgi:hypothetical protein